jgi:phosphate transport system substrate-binding protein
VTYAKLGGFALAAALIVTACSGGSSSNARPSSGSSTALPSGPSAAPATAPSSGAVSGVTGEIFVSGSSTVQPISQAVSEDFNAANPEFGYTVEGPGTGDGFALLCDSTIDVADASRTIRDTEADACSTGGVDYAELKIAYDGITVMTHPDTPIDCLATTDLYALFGPESDDITTWSDAAALAGEAGSTTSFPADLALQITAPGPESGTYDAFIELSGIDDLAGDRGVLADGDDPQLRVPGPNYTESSNDNVIVEGVEAGAGSLGFVGFAFYEGAGDLVKAVAVDAGEGCVSPTIETIADGSYPLSRPLYIYPSLTREAVNPALAPWVDYYLSDDGIANVTDAGYVALPEDELEATRSAWTGR